MEGKEVPITKKGAGFQKESFEILDNALNGDFLGAIKHFPLEALIDLLESGVIQNPENLGSLMKELNLQVLKGSYGMIQAEKLAKLSLHFLKIGDEEISFEAACILKDLQLPQSYPGIIRLLENGEGINDPTKRMLKSAAENIALSVSISILETTKGYRSERWKRRAFLRMSRHRNYLDSLGSKKKEDCAQRKLKR